MSSCPQCGQPTRMQVSLYLDLPTKHYGRINKSTVRLREVEIQGAGWPSVLFYCPTPGCGWTEKHDNMRDVRQRFVGVLAQRVWIKLPRSSLAVHADDHYLTQLRPEEAQDGNGGASSDNDRT